jgi:hypothetical protein
MIFMALQQATSPGFNTPQHPRKCLLVRQQMSFRGRGRRWRENNTVFFTAKKFMVFDVLPRGSIFNQLYFTNNMFPDLETANLNFQHQKGGSNFWVHMKLSMCESGSKIMSKIKKNHISRMPYPPDSPYISLRNFWLFGMFQ